VSHGLARAWRTSGNAIRDAGHSIKYEKVHLKAYADGREARIGIGQWMEFYNHRRTRP